MKNLYLIIGRSGSGKTTMVNELCKRYNYSSVESYTTRKPRYEGEKGHTFISKEEFDKKQMVAYTLFDGYEYGVDADMLKNADLYIIDIPGAKRLFELYKDKRIVSIYIKCDRDILIERMKLRGDTKYQIEKRLSNDDEMFKEEATFKFDYVLNNVDMFTSYNVIHNIIEAEELKGKIFT